MKIRKENNKKLSPLLIILTLWATNFFLLFFYFWFFLLLFFFLLFFLFSLFSFFSFISLSLSTSAILIFPASVFTISYIFLDILSSLLFLFSNWSLDCGKQATAFLKLHSTSIHQSHQSPFFFYYQSWKQWTLIIFNFFLISTFNSFYFGT